MTGATTSGAAAAAGLLLQRPAVPKQAARPAPSVHPLGLVPNRDTLLFVPARYTANQPAPLALLFHGAGGVAEYGLSLLQGLADKANLLLLAPASRGPTWDIIQNDYGPDVALIDQALEHVFTRYAVDPTHLAIGGFSDGASYALSLGLTNGDPFTHIIGPGTE